VPAFVPADAWEVAKCRASFTRGARRVIVSIGRLSSEKGQFELLEALALLHRNGTLTDTVTVIVGDGVDRAKLEARSISEGIEQHMVFAGHQGDVRPFWAVADVFVLPSRSEGSPNVILEAMAAQVPIASTAAGGVVEILENEVTALVVPTRDPPSLSNALQRLLEDDALRARLKGAALDAVLSRFTPDAYRRTLLGFYQEAVSGQSSREGQCPKSQ
jgi:glycosyltransferase involved in cell wall biosynthesis